MKPRLIKILLLPFEARKLDFTISFMNTLRDLSVLFSSVV